MKLSRWFNATLLGSCLAVACATYAAPPEEPPVRETPGSAANSGMPEQVEPRQSVGAFAADTVITTKVKAALLAESSISLLKISVKTTDGVVHLTGTAESQAQIDTAVNVAQGIDGVKSVANDLKIEAG